MNIFPIIKRFNDVKSNVSTVILKEETSIYNKSFRAGTIFFILGWREINEKPYLVLSKGSWEGLVDYEEFVNLIETI
jgi:hypothetical protein